MSVELTPRAINLIRRALLVYLEERCPEKHVATLEAILAEFIRLEQENPISNGEAK